MVLVILKSSLVYAQKIDSIYVNLYTDSLKKGTYNYINIDGLLSNGRYLPLDSTEIIFSSSYGKFYGNSLLIERDCKVDKVKINVSLRKNPALHKEFVMHIKKKEDNEKLPTSQEILDKMKKKG
ncbi:MAG: hypothetical protein ABIO04_11715 [Ferruginibacter sp.]